VSDGPKIAEGGYILKKHFTIPAFLNNASTEIQNSKKSKI